MAASIQSYGEASENDVAREFHRTSVMCKSLPIMRHGLAPTMSQPSRSRDVRSEWAHAARLSSWPAATTAIRLCAQRAKDAKGISFGRSHRHVPDRDRRHRRM